MIESITEVVNILDNLSDYNDELNYKLSNADMRL